MTNRDERTRAVVLANDERGEAYAFEAGVLRIACERSHPPGQPLSFSVELDPESLELQGKSAGTRRRADGRFDVQVKLHSLRREQRERLEQAFGR